MQNILTAILIVLVAIFLFLRTNRVEKQLMVLLGIVGNIKYRLFNHEAQLLERNGVYVPDESAKFVFNNIWNMLDITQKESIEKEYNQKSPNYIPLWKYVLYNYKVETKVVPLQTIAKIDSINDIIMSDFFDMKESFQELQKQIENLEKISNSVEKIDETINKETNENKMKERDRENDNK